MKFLQAGDRRLIALEPEQDLIRKVAGKAGFDCTLEDGERHLVLELRPNSGDDPLLLFDGSDVANLGWFSRCQFYVDALTGNVLQTPFTVANCRDRKGRLLSRLRLSVAKELPAHFRLPGSQTVSEEVVYSLLYHFLNALRSSGVAICGKGGVAPLAGRSQSVGPRN